MNRNVMIVLAGGFLIAILVALLVQASLSGNKDPVVLEEEPKVKIIVASKDLKAGTTLDETNMKWQDWPEDAAFPGAVQQEGDKKPDEMLDGLLKRSVEKGEPIVRSALVSDAGGNYVAATLSPGMRAYAVHVKARDGQKMVGGFVRPGDYVDVILTYDVRLSLYGEPNPEMRSAMDQAVDELVTETIVQNVRVLAVDRDAGTDEESAVRLAKTVTLEVNFRQAEVLALGTAMGDISLSLRRIGDNQIYKDDALVTTDARTATIDNEVQSELKNVQVNSGQATEIVRIYRGDAIEEVPVTP